MNDLDFEFMNAFSHLFKVLKTIWVFLLQFSSMQRNSHGGSTITCCSSNGSQIVWTDLWTDVFNLFTHDVH
jgi:hypothetical protein